MIRYDIEGSHFTAQEARKAMEYQRSFANQLRNVHQLILSQAEEGKGQVIVNGESFLCRNEIIDRLIEDGYEVNSMFNGNILIKWETGK